MTDHVKPYQTMLDHIRPWPMDMTGTGTKSKAGTRNETGPEQALDRDHDRDQNQD